MNALEKTPADMDADPSKKTITIVWKDSHTSVYPYDYIRKNCPCAHCKDSKESQKRSPGGGLVELKLINEDVVGTSSDIVEVEDVGRYALKFTWGDGHDTGIYSFEHLREICPCDKCKEA